MRILRALLVLAAASAGAAAARALLTRSRRDGVAARAGMDRWPPVPRKPGQAA